MMRRSKWPWIIGVAALLAVGGVGVVFAWSKRDPWPPRLVIPGPVPGQGMAWGYSPDGRWFRTTSVAGLTLWDTTTGERGVTVPPPLVWRKTVSNDGRRFVGWVGDDFAAAEVVVGDAATEAIEQRFPVQGVQGTELAFRDGDRSIRAVLSDRSERMAIATWDLASGAESRRAIRGPGASYTRPIAYSPDGQIWAYLDVTRDGLQLWDVGADRPIGGLLRTPTTERNLSAWRWAGAEFTPDGRTLIASRSDGQVELWDVATGRLNKLIPLHPNRYTAMHMKILPDGRTLISTGSILPSPSRFLQIWDFLYSIGGFGPSPTQSSQETVVVDLTTDQVLARARRCRAVDIAPDGRTVATQDLAGTISFRVIPQPAGP